METYTYNGTCIIVSGLPSSGTSPMMEMLVKGGVKPYYNKIREEVMKGFKHSDPGNDHFFEVGDAEYMRFGFSSTIPDGYACKIQAKGLPLLSAGRQYKIIFMRRNPEEIKASYKKRFPNDSFFYDQGCWPEDYYQCINTVLGILGARVDVQLLQIHYDEMIAYPQATVNQLVYDLGIPLTNLEEVASVPKSTRKRTKVA